MLDKRKIDNLRDLLVGVVPNPIDQVKQITMALVYKFMNDMDSFNENFAGKKIYFVIDYAKYAWHGLMDEKLSNLERFHLYAEAIQALEEKGFTNLYNLKGGIVAYAKEVDESLPVY